MMKLATIELPAYLYDTDDAKITVEDNVRFTMKDIGKLEDRIENLEVTSSLSLLELDTKTLQIQDADGLSRFKTGFFVDDFKNLNFGIALSWFVMWIICVSPIRPSSILFFNNINSLSNLLFKPTWTIVF